jgi:adenylate cyclase
MSLLTKATIAGLLLGALGLVISLTPSGEYLEENFGLHFLFKTRGTRQAPAEVVIISMDKASADRLNLPSSPRKWPRSLHARLIHTLIAKKPAVIAFDIIFSEDFSPQHDQIFAEAIRDAGNVVLGEWLTMDRVPVFDRSGNQTGDINIESIVRPIFSFADSALATAPFALPKVPIRVNNYWVFKTGAGDIPTLPAVIFQIYALQVYNELIVLLKKIDPALSRKLPPSADAVVADKRIKEAALILRDYFKRDPTMAEKILKQLKISKLFSNDPRKHQILESLMQMYHGPDSLYLNLYGPPGTIKTIPYYQIIEGLEDPAVYPDQLDLRGKAILIGLSERMRPEQKDGFYTVFSQPSGLDISGVEIAASAFGNILENKHVRPLGASEHLAVVGFWGIMIGVLCILSPALVGASGVVCLSLAYMLAIHYQFKHAALWFPLVVPVCFQAPAAFFGSVFWKYFRANKERKNIRTAFGYYLPDEIVNQLAKSLSNIQNSSQVVYGTCLVTDIEQYTAISEGMDPEDLSQFMNQYFEVIFEPVKQNSGIVSDVKGDSMLAIWAMARPDASIRNLACKTALDIIEAVNQFNRSSGVTQLPTRIGMHSGYISLGHIGAIDHYEYRPVGDIVNTASRMEGLNKYMGTQIIVSEEVLLQLDGFLIRPLGRFILAGKSKPIEAYELICRIEECTEKQKDACREFNGALVAFQRQCWEEAIDLLSKTLKICGEDGPSHFYLELCDTYRANPPGSTWNGTVYLDKK